MFRVFQAALVYVVHRLYRQMPGKLKCASSAHLAIYIAEAYGDSKWREIAKKSEAAKIEMAM